MTTHDIETLIGKLRKGVVVEELPLGNIVHLTEANSAMREAADALEALQRERDYWFKEAEDRANSCSLIMRERDRQARLILELRGDSFWRSKAGREALKDAQ